MTADDLIEIVPADENDPRIQAALVELRELIAAHFPTATFEVVRGEDPEGIYLLPTVDVEDLDEAAAVFMPRLVDMQVDGGLPVYVFPDVPLERLREHLRRQPARPPTERLPILAP